MGLGRRARILVTGAIAASAIAIAVAPPTGGGGGSGVANFWVDTNGGTCTRQATAGAWVDAAACSSINTAYQAASPGDTIIVKNGTYSAQSIGEKTGAAAPNITISTETGATTPIGSLSVRGSYATVTGNFTGSNLTVDANANGAANKPIRNVTVDGMTVNAGNAVNAATYFRGADTLTLRNMDISNNNNTSLMMTDFDPAAGGLTNIWIDRSVIHDAHLDSGSSAHTECFYAQGINYLKITNSRFYRCAVMDVFITRWTGTSVDPQHGYIENNVFEAPMTAGNGCCSANAFHFRDGGEPAPDIYDWDFRYNTFGAGANLSFGTASENIVQASGLRVVGNILGGGAGCRTTNTTWSYNVHATGFSCSGTGNVTASAASIDSGYVGPTTSLGSSNNYQLLTGSPAKDIPGATSLAFPSTDLLQRSRPFNTLPDAGAYEFGAS